MSGTTRPQAVGTESDAWLWQWRTFEGIEPWQVEHEHELEWLRTERRWQVRSSYDRAGWSPPRRVGDFGEEPLSDPDSYDHAEQLAHEYADRPRGGAA